MIRNISIFLICNFFLLTKIIAGYQQGKIVLINNDTITCEIKVYDKNVFITSDANNFISYKIDNAIQKIEFSNVDKILFDSIVYVKAYLPYKIMIMRGGNMVQTTENQFSFVQLEINGNAQLLKRYYLQSSGGSSIGGFSASGQMHLVKDYFIKRNNLIVNISRISFKKNIKTVFPDCKVLQEKVKNSELNYDNLAYLVECANSDCCKP